MLTTITTPAPAVIALLGRTPRRGTRRPHPRQTTSDTQDISGRDWEISFCKNCRQWFWKEIV